MFRNIARDGLLAWTSRPKSRSFRLGILTAMFVQEITIAARDDYAGAREAFSQAWEVIDDAFRKYQPPPKPRESVWRANERSYRQSAYAIEKERKVEHWRAHARVYFVQRVDGDGPIKIGVSADPRERLKDLQVASAFPLHIVATVPGDDTAEYRLHQRFAADRLNGEWFRPSAALLSFIASLPQGAK